MSGREGAGKDEGSVIPLAGSSQNAFKRTGHESPVRLVSIVIRVSLVTFASLVAESMENCN